MKRSPILVLVGPTAVGKGTVVAHLREKYPQVCVSISATTRQPRPGEADGIHYFFVTDEEFDAMIANGELLEWAEVHSLHRYGTPRRWVDQQVEAGHSVVLEIDLDGARQVRRTLPSAIFVFLAPPSWEELVSRLQGRASESPEEQERRLATAKVELAAADEFDYVVTNTNVEDTVRELANLLDLS